jgi:hypothetical protein
MLNFSNDLADLLFAQRPAIRGQATDQFAFQFLVHILGTFIVAQDISGQGQGAASAPGRVRRR